ncbi:apolipo A-I-like protein [Labeo rohita]|uniref:Platelet-activating factor acetylhydrolase IB subunit alpha2 n=1 Tax=Labeo rohita TaxID=84645 RepID=A0A498MV37_LABRO|nr:apolipo A-I-like protein [Labeo rohita]
MSAEENPAAEPAPVIDVQGDGRWMSQHNRFVQECKDAEPDVLFVGDSMVQLMQQYEVWRELFSPLHALNFGIGGDTTCNLLWRLQNGELENIRPRVVVLWVGTNNHEHTADQVAGGILAIAQLLLSRLPKSKIIVLSLTMKFVALALTILLAVGSQARFLQADAPSQLEHYKAAALVYLSQVKEQAQKAFDNLDRTDYEQYKVQLSESLTKLQDYAQSTSQTLTPYAESISNQFLENTKQLRERVMTDLEDLRSKLEPHRAELYVVLQKHFDEYREKLEPVIQEYATLNRENAEQLRAKLEPVLEEMRQKFESNVEETKSKLVPMVEAIRAKLTEHLEELKSMAAPYAEEYKEQLVKAVEEAKEKLAPHTQDLQARMEPYVENARAKFAQVYETIAQAIQA